VSEVLLPKQPSKVLMFSRILEPATDKDSKH